MLWEGRSAAAMHETKRRRRLPAGEGAGELALESGCRPGGRDGPPDLQVIAVAGPVADRVLHGDEQFRTVRAAGPDGDDSALALLRRLGAPRPLPVSLEAVHLSKEDAGLVPAVRHPSVVRKRSIGSGGALVA